MLFTASEYRAWASGVLRPSTMPDIAKRSSWYCPNFSLRQSASCSRRRVSEYVMSAAIIAVMTEAAAVNTASGMARADIPPHIVSRVLNHSSGKTEGITAVYNRHGYLREKRSALEGWARKLESIIAPAGANVVQLRG